MKWLYKLDYKFGNYYIRRLMTIIVAGMAVAYVAQMMMPTVNVYGWMALTREGVLGLQLWRLVTFLFIPSSSGILTFIMLYFYWLIGSSLERAWGGFRFNLYYLLGWLGAIIVMFITGYATNSYLYLSMFLALATLSPDATFLLFFILPIKAKWLAGAYAVLAILSVIQAFVVYPGFMVGLSALATLAFSLLNYFIFFGASLFRSLGDELKYRKNRRQWRNNNR